MSVFDQVALFLVIVVPLAGALLVAFMPKDQTKDVWYFAILVSAISLVLSVVIFARYDYGEGGYQLVRTFQWLEAPLNINLSLGIDGIAAPLVLLNGIVLFGAVLISCVLLPQQDLRDQDQSNEPKHCARPCDLLLQAGEFGVICGDIHPGSKPAPRGKQTDLRCPQLRHPLVALL